MLTSNLLSSSTQIKYQDARWTPGRAVWVLALKGVIVLCSCARHITPTVPLSAQVYKWVLANLMLGVTLRWTSIPSRAV